MFKQLNNVQLINGKLLTKTVEDAEAFIKFYLNNEKDFVERNDIKLSTRANLSGENTEFKFESVICQNYSSSLNVILHSIQQEVNRFNKFNSQRNEVIAKLDTLNQRIA